MLLAVVLLYVGAVLGVNGIWLIGGARAAAAAAVPARVGAAVVVAPPPRPSARRCSCRAARSR